MKKNITADSGLGTIVNHYGHEENSMNAHLMPIYQTSTFSFPDVENWRENILRATSRLCVYPKRQP